MNTYIHVCRIRFLFCNDICRLSKKSCLKRVILEASGTFVELLNSRSGLNKQLLVIKGSCCKLIVLEEQIKKALGDNYNLIKRNMIAELPNGRHYLKNGIYVNIEEYETYPRFSRKFEAHKRFVDIQYIISGCENIITQDYHSLYAGEPWDYSSDIVFMNDNGFGQKHILHQGEFLCLFPTEAHMPCIMQQLKSERVRKAVFKVPYSLFKEIKYLVMDVDGTLTDGKIYMGSEGEIFKAFDIKDGLGINKLLPQKNIIPVIITGRKSDILERRCKEIHIENVFQGIEDKLGILKKFISENNVGMNHIAYIGDDINDFDCMEAVKREGGLIGCPANSSRVVLEIADFVSYMTGGNGAVREFIEWLNY